MGIFGRYNDLLLRRPYATNMISTGIFFGIGDLVAQGVGIYFHDEDSEKPGFTYPRTVRAITYGALIFAPISVKWHRNTLPNLKNPFVSKARRSFMESDKKFHSRLHLYDVTYRVLLDQILMVPFVFIPLYNTAMTTMAGYPNPLQLTAQRLQDKWWTVLKASWVIWPSFQMVNFYYIPFHIRNVAANVWSIGWTSFLSFIHHSKGHGKGSGHKIEELIDIKDEEQEVTMIYD